MVRPDRRPFLILSSLLFTAVTWTIAGAGCGGDDTPAEPDAGPVCELAAFERGGEGSADPLGAGPAEARAGRIRGEALPPVASGLITWADGDWVLANDKIALVIEDAGASDLYDPWGGRPVGMARVSGGALIEPADFGEFFLLTGRSSIVTESVSVLSDGSDGGPAIVRATGRLAPVPFFDNLTSFLFRDGFTDVEAALDYVLAPGSEHVDVVFRYRSRRQAPIQVATIMHGFMYTKRTPIFQPGIGFEDTIDATRYVGLIDDDATSWAYFNADGSAGTELGAGISASGFVSGFTDGYSIDPCAETERLHARLVLGGPGLDGLVQAVARDTGDQVRTITGSVTENSGAPAVGVRVHAEALDDGAYLTRTSTGDDGSFSLTVPTGTAVRLSTFRRGDEVVTGEVAADSVVAPPLTLVGTGWVHVVATEDNGAGQRLPVRVQLLPVGGGSVPSLPSYFGEPEITSDRLQVAYAMNGEVTLRAPVGTWEVVVSRGYEYELVRQTVEVGLGATVEVAAALEHTVDTAGIQCGDFHIHTTRSNDADDDGKIKVMSAVADGLDIPVRSEHEFVGGFQEEIEELGLEPWAFGPPSIEMTSMELWGHMGVFPLEPDRSAVNGGAPLWQDFPSALEPNKALRTMGPKEVFDRVRARPEAPVIIINHPRGNTNYFGYVGYDAATGMVDPSLASDWDTDFTLVEVFNGSGWLSNLEGTVRDWLSFNRAGRHVFAVGSSDSHGIAGTPVGYPRTCIELGTDDPRQLTADGVRDALAAGHSTISGGIYLSVDAGGAGPGDTLNGAATSTEVDVTVQAASWIDVDFLDVVVDGVVVDTIDIAPGDADPSNPTVRFHAAVPVTVAPGGSFVVFAAYGDAPLEPVHPGQLPFAATNPVYLQP